MNERSQWNEMEPKWSQRRRIFRYNIALYVIINNEDHVLKSIKDYRKGKYLQMERDSSSEIKLFEPVACTLEDVKLNGYIWLFPRKEN